MKRLLLGLLFSVAATVSLHAQDNLPIDLLTGTAKINIPLFKIEEGDMSFPVSLSYSGQSVDILSSSGWMGQNWNISAEAMVSRELRGLPDDFLGGGGNDVRKGWLHGDMGTRVKNFAINTDNDPATCADEVANWNALNTFSTDEDFEPDLFSVNAFGLSFQFYFDENKQPQVVPHRNVKIGYTTDPVTSQIKTIQILDELGQTFNFTAVETSTLTYSAELDVEDYCFVREFKSRSGAQRLLRFNTAWKLTSIVSPLNSTITFSYKPHSLGSSYIAGLFSRKPVFNYPMEINNEWFHPHPIKKGSSITLQVLEKIVTTSSEIRFVSYALMDSSRILTKVQFYERRSGTSQYVQEFNFARYESSYLEYDPLAGEDVVVGMRTYLALISHKVGALSKPPYQFEYNNFSALPDPGSRKKDEWGFFLDKPAYYDQTAETGVLKKVIYPTGGYDLFLYEANDYWDNATSATVQGGGVRVRKLLSHDGISSAADMVKEFFYRRPDGQSSGKLAYKGIRSFSTVRLNSVYNQTRLRDMQILVNAGTHTGPAEKYFVLKTDENINPATFVNGNVIAYSAVTVTTPGFGKTSYEFDLPAMTDDLTADNGAWNRSTVFLARPSTGTTACYDKGGIPVGADVYPFPKNPNYDFARGLLRKVTDYNEAGVIVRDTNYEYQKLFGNGAGIRKIYGLSLEELPTYYFNGTAYVDSKMFLFSKYEINTDVIYKPSKITETLYHTADQLKKFQTITNLFYESTTHRELTKVSVVNSNLDESIVRYKYVNDYTVNAASTDVRANALNSMKVKHINSKIEEVKSTITGGVEKTSKATLTTYKDIGGKIAVFEGLSFQSPDGSTTFTTSQTTAGPNSVLQYATGYSVDVVNTNIDAVGNVVESEGRNKIPQSVATGYGNTLPVISFMNARLGEVGFSDFETSTDVQFSYQAGNPTYTAGRTGAKSLNFPIGASYKLVRSITGHTSLKDNFSIWIKAPSSGTLSLAFKNGSTNLITPVQIAFTASTEWKYYTASFNTNTLPASYTLELSTSVAITVDDVAYYPAHANIISYTYTLPHGKASETDSRGITRYYQYDEWGRLNLVLDQDKNIISKTDLHLKP
jgi:hypothetical protein